MALVATEKLSSCDVRLLRHCATAVVSSGESTYWHFGDHVINNTRICKYSARTAQ